MLANYSDVFSWCNMLAMFGWALLMLSPKRWTWVLVTSGIIIPVAFGLLYGGLMLANAASAEGAGYASLSQVRTFMSYDPTLLAGWIHYLCFDLIIGTLIAYEADKAGITRLVQIPILIATFQLGPVGFVLFVITRFSWQALAHKQSLGASS